MKKYPIGIQSFEKIREGGYLYVDKTRYLHELVEQGGYHFLSRPRRFGKSLTVSTLKAIFEGKKELFKGLWIGDKYGFTEEYPVIHLEFNNLGHREAGLMAALDYRMGEIGKQHGIGLDAPSPGLKFDQLVRALSKRNKVVVLIDEYDKPVLDYLEDPEKARDVRDGLKSFYAPLKSLDPHLRFVLLTGVSKFSRMSIFSELNNLNDLSRHARFANMLGYTEEEMVEYFSGEVEGLAQHDGRRPEEVWGDIRRWYNGYSWDGKARVYNPFSVLSFFDSGQFHNFWFQTGTPTFLVKLLREDLSVDYSGYRTDMLTLDSGFELDFMDPVALLFQTGYLTVTGIDGMTVTLDYPNREVHDSLFRYLLTGFAHRPLSRATPMVEKLARAFEDNDLAGFAEGLDGLFADIPAELFQAKSEAYYHSLTHLALYLLGTRVRSEVRSRRGRVDAVVETASHVYVLEFKVGAAAKTAIQQIREKGYADPYRNDGREVLLVGVGFSSERKGVGEWRAEVL